MLASDTKNEIVARLSPKKPHKVIIFGSQALQGGDEGSDIDLIVVLDKDGIPGNYREKTENYLEISRELRDLNKQMAIDLVVMTRTQWEQFIEMDSGFAREIQSRGLPLI